MGHLVLKVIKANGLHYRLDELIPETTVFYFKLINQKFCCCYTFYKMSCHFNFLLFIFAATVFACILTRLSSASSVPTSPPTSNSSCQCRRRPAEQLARAFKLANQPDCIHLDTLEASKIPCTQAGHSRNVSRPSFKRNSSSTPFHIVSWDTRCLAAFTLSTECFGRRKRECTWTEAVRRVRAEPGETEVFPAFEVQVNCEGCNQTSCLANSGSCSYRQNLVRYLPLVRTGRCAGDGYEEWVESKKFRLVNAACSCIYHPNTP